jgi:hypothetical protein
MKDELMYTPHPAQVINIYLFHIINVFFVIYIYVAIILLFLFYTFMLVFNSYRTVAAEIWKWVVI